MQVIIHADTPSYFTAAGDFDCAFTKSRLGHRIIETLGSDITPTLYEDHGPRGFPFAHRAHARPRSGVARRVFCAHVLSPPRAISGPPAARARLGARQEFHVRHLRQ